MRSSNMARPAKACPLCEGGIRVLNYKDERTISRLMTEQGKFLPRRMTGMCARHQRQSTTAIKRARYLALVPYVKGYAD
jgi:small subunit ribosomal protein S18